MNRIFLVAMALMATGCASRERLAAGDQERCSSYGFAPGTEAFAHCMMTADTQRRDHIDARRRAILNSVDERPMR